MADKNKKGDSEKRLNEDQRFSYIGFEVFPGKPKDLFKNDNEKKQLEEKVAERRDKGEILREDCTLLVERVSMGERILLTVASLMIIGALFFPFYSAYSEIEIIDEIAVAEVPVTSDLIDDTTGVADTTGVVPEAVAGEAVVEDSIAIVADLSDSAEVIADESAGKSDDRSGQNVIIDEKGNEIITGLVARKKYSKEFERVSGFGSLIAIGSLGSYLFSSGFVLLITAVLYLLYTLACLALPGFTLYSIYGSGAKGDELVLKMKKILKMSWYPIALFVVTVFLSFFGAEYGFSTTDMFSSIGSSYGIGVLLDSLSYGITISLGGFIILAAKGSEI